MKWFIGGLLLYVTLLILLNNPFQAGGMYEDYKQMSGHFRTAPFRPVLFDTYYYVTKDKMYIVVPARAVVAYAGTVLRTGNQFVNTDPIDGQKAHFTDRVLWLADSKGRSYRVLSPINMVRIARLVSRCREAAEKRLTFDLKPCTD
jgi:hypothetical protein